ncbi:SCO family protein [Deinococcus enclensis]|uniref:Protein SCO1/2 n=1 Tax=Deinococcus enclensis TaxID=1049582 RepID=A0ABT9M9L8_9DEIO|nr:SCO family protein [Deinococcus enclensis]MDP9763276.1 protein SCO1/2 [Deinococcus enclensis]
MKWITGVLLAVAALLAGLLLFRTSAPAELGGEALDDPKVLPALKLVDDRGEPTTLPSADGRVRLVFYGFVRCPDVCPATLTSLKTTYATLPDDLKRRVWVQFITVDPEYDRPNVVRAYLDRFDPAFTGLTGDPETIDEAARQMFVGNVKPQAAPATDHGAHAAPPSGETTADAEAPAGGAAQVASRLHGDQVSILDGQGRFVRVYGNTAVIDGTLQRDLPQLVRQYAN